MTIATCEFGTMPAKYKFSSVISLLGCCSDCRMTDGLWNIASAIYLYSTMVRPEGTWASGTSLV